MYSAQTANGLGVTDGSGTINPAALNSSGKIVLVMRTYMISRLNRILLHAMRHLCLN